jgi:hypothetical protein
LLVKRLLEILEVLQEHHQEDMSGEEAAALEPLVKPLHHQHRRVQEEQGCYLQ